LCLEQFHCAFSHLEAWLISVRSGQQAAKARSLRLFGYLVPGVFIVLLLPCCSGKSCLEPQGREADCPGSTVLAAIAWAATPTGTARAPPLPLQHPHSCPRVATGLVAFSTGKARMPMKQISV